MRLGRCGASSLAALECCWDEPDLEQEILHTCPKEIRKKLALSEKEPDRRKSVTTSGSTRFFIVSVLRSFSVLSLILNGKLHVHKFSNQKLQLARLYLLSYFCPFCQVVVKTVSLLNL